MGLDVSHDAFSAPYSAFHRWRVWLAEQIGMPPLNLMEGMQLPFNPETTNPIDWDILKPDPLHELLSHCDCDGKIGWENCKAIADRLTKIIEANSAVQYEGAAGIHGNSMIAVTERFRDGLMLASDRQENLTFG